MGLNEEQQSVVDNPQGARCVLAGPGSGKTKTMVELVHDLMSRGVLASDIKCVTFSKEAAAQIERRAKVKGVFSTLHSLGYSICSDIARKPVEPELRHRLMMRLVGKWRLDYKEFDQFIARMRRSNTSPDDAQEINYAMGRAFGEYEMTRSREGWMDFDSMLRDAVDMLEANPGLRARWQPRYLIVDEAQDTDDLQWRMMQLMSEKHGNITVVGDPNQAIYGFRGARPENITEFQRWFPGGRYYFLGRNYRSTQNIVKFVRENVPDDAPQELIDRMVSAREEKGQPIAMKMYLLEDQEVEAALKRAQEDPFNSIILARTNRMIGLVERKCEKMNIRYHLLGKTGFWKQNEIRKALEALKPYEMQPTASAFGIVMRDLQRHYAVDDRTDKDNDALENLETLRAISKEFPRTAEFLAYANKRVHRKNEAKGVTLSTVHQAKGGEWKNVFVIGVKARGFPHEDGDPLEEQRIYFVAISRAIDYLRISFSGTPSPYLRKYLTEEILDKLRKAAEEVDHLQEQTRLFPEGV